MIPAPDVSSAFALDVHGLDALRLQAQQNPQQALKAVAQQFEAVFLQTLLKSMRAATPQDGPMDNDQTRLYTSMLDQQLAQTLSVKGIGLADVMLRQLTRNQAAAAGAAAATQATGPSASPAGANAAPRPAAAGGSAAGPNASRSFLLRMKEDALHASSATGIPARFLLGHAALESGWGRHEIRAADGSRSFNLFGIKAGRNWKGPSVSAMTTEYIDGTPHKVLQKFRAYGSYAEAFQDYASLMRDSPRYAAVLKQSDSAGFARSLQRAGYATDPLYAAKLTRILNSPAMRQTMMA
ncbi:MAG TPA: flagellar assembly peptidoglycan hydrolase FlgJ [Burkholderiales bacterium]|nr:flagellar assembly peptidoglycan hydrolase FlgJ [Burkholderiales bacterium]